MDLLGLGAEVDDWRALKIMFFMDRKPTDRDRSAFRVRVAVNFRLLYGDWSVHFPNEPRPPVIKIPPSTETQLEKGRYEYPVTDGSVQPDEKWKVEVLLKGDEPGDWRALKIMLMMDHQPTLTEQASLRARAVGEYRVAYAAWTNRTADITYTQVLPRAEPQAVAA